MTVKILCGINIGYLTWAPVNKVVGEGMIHGNLPRFGVDLFLLAYIRMESQNTLDMIFPFQIVF